MFPLFPVAGRHPFSPVSSQAVTFHIVPWLVMDRSDSSLDHGFLEEGTFVWCPCGHWCLTAFGTVSYGTQEIGIHWVIGEVSRSTENNPPNGDLWRLWTRANGRNSVLMALGKEWRRMFETWVEAVFPPLYSPIASHLLDTKVTADF